MAIKDWHGGQLVILWVGAFLAAAIALMALYFVGTFSDPVGIAWIVIASIVLPAILATPVVLLVITWKWFGGKRQGH